jgi:plastocyanin
LTAVALLGASVVTLPAVAGSETSPTINAENKPGSGIYLEERHAWNPPSATIAAGGAVAIANQTEVPHGVRWVSGASTPSCSGIPVGTTAEASGTKWSGTCTFSQPGTYTFYCTVHGAEMSGTITVSGAGTVTPTQPTTPTGGPFTTPSNPLGEPSSGTGSQPGSPLAGSAVTAVRFPSRQHGKAVHGSVVVSATGAGGRLEIDLLARSASLVSAGHAAPVRVGRIVRSSLTAGTARFSILLNRRARAALERKGRLALSVKLVIKPTSGAAMSVTRGVVLHA